MPDQAPLQTPHVTASDRLGLTLFFAVVFHAVVILGVTFSVPGKPPEETLNSLEVTLVKTRSDIAPEEADYLAQANRAGDGNTRERVRPTEAAAQPKTSESELPGRSDTQKLVTPGQPTPPVPTQNELLTKKEAEEKIKKAERSREQTPRKLSAGALIARSMEIASLSAEVKQRQLAYSKRERHKHISANTREYKYASYMDAWRAKVERIGRLNYPEEANRRGITGNLLLDVSLNADGTVRGIGILRSSGSKVLDDAAIRIVRLAAPFAQLPENIRKETDVLHIIRTWVFKSGGALYTK